MPAPTTSTVPAVMVALKARLAARAGLAGVQITDGYPWQPAGDYIAILHADPHEQEPAALGRQGQEETFTLRVDISALRRGDSDHTETVARAYVLAAEIENEIRADRTVNGSLPSGWAVLVGLPVRKHGPNKEGVREAVIAARIKCRARI